VTRFVLDTSVLMAIAQNEPGAAEALTYLKNNRCVMHEVNVSELCFTLPRKHPSKFTPTKTRAWLDRLGVRAISGFSPDLGRLVADIRTQNQALNLGDGVAMATAFLMDTPVLTAEKAFAKSPTFAKVELIR